MRKRNAGSFERLSLFPSAAAAWLWKELMSVPYTSTSILASCSPSGVSQADFALLEVVMSPASCRWSITSQS